MVELRTATQADVEQYFGKKPDFSLRGVVAVEDGKTIGVGGVYRAGAQIMVFVDMKDEMRKYPKLIVKAGKLVLPYINRYTVVMAYVKPEQEAAMRFAKHFGFEDTGEVTTYGKVFIRWNR